MKNVFANWKLLPALLVALVTWACADAAQTLGPSQVSRTDGTTTTVKYKPLKGKYDGKTRYDEQVLQPSSGGSVGVAGTVLIVPTGAVSEPTLFTMKLASSDSLGITKLQVELRAYQKDSKGKYSIDVGAQGFLKPVELRLGTDWITDSFDPAQVRVAWMKNEAGDQEIYVTDIAPDGRFRSYLGHFSDYALVMP